jgi:hypothetical protein
MPSAVDPAATLLEDDAVHERLPEAEGAATFTRPLQNTRGELSGARTRGGDDGDGEDGGGATPPEETQPGRILADRYRLVERLGEGAHGEVWTVDDLVLREPLALKWMRSSSGASLPRIRREITTLRMLRIPGVVRLFDDGLEDGRPFLVMERVKGRPFPGDAARCPGSPQRFSWAAIADTTLALLEVLSRVHAAGVVHRDLKPDNILVDAAGRPTVLDFGISLWHDPDRGAGSGQIVGTPHYLAPEQIFGRFVDARADLYAVGVMLYEALTGRPPHEAPDVRSLLRARLANPTRPVRELAPDIPATVGEVVDRLLSVRAEGRFRSAPDVLAALRGAAHAAGTAPTLPWLGSRRPIDAVLGAAASARSIDVVGPSGSGRSRCLREAAEALQEQDRRVIWLEPAHAPLASLRAMSGAPEDTAASEPAEAAARVEARLRAALAEGAIVFADDAERLDPVSAAVLDSCRAARGTIVRALLSPPPGAGPEDIAELSPLDEAALRLLFAGPDRLFHFREDAARLLRARTEGRPALVEAEVTLWTRLGLARWAGAVLAVDRDSLSRMTTSPLKRSPARATSTEPAREPHIEELSVRREEVHVGMAEALQPGQEGRLFHLLAADRTREAAREAVVLSRRRAREGDLGGATAALSEGLRAVRRQGGGEWADEEERILGEWVKVAFEEGTPYAIDRALYELSRARDGRPEVRRLENLLRCIHKAWGADALHALESADEIAPFEDAELERVRHWARVAAAVTRASPAMIEELLEDVAAWAARSGDPISQLSLAEGRARLRYGQGRFEEAAALSAEAAERAPWLIGRIAATLRVATALLEAFRHRESAERAAEARELAARCRDVWREGRAEWLLRAAKYRMGEAGAPDLELVDAVARVGVPELEALVYLNEAAVAFREGELALAVELAGRSEKEWKALNRPGGPLLARALALACGARAEAGEVEALSDKAAACRIPGIGIQVLGLLGRAFPEARPRWQEAVPRLAGMIPREHWGERVDVLSVAEALAGAVGDIAEGVYT